jgi:serine/threonine-protein kinase RsbW
MAEVNLHQMATTASAAGVRHALDEFERFGRAQGLPDDLRRRVLVALDEVLANVSRHGGSSDSQVYLDFRVTADRLTVTVEDPGPAFNPLDAPPADTASALEQRKAGGLGIELVRKLFESVRYEHTGGRNRLTITDRISREADRS